MDILYITYVFIALVTIAFSIPLIARKIGPNVVYGFRVRKTLENPEVWYAVNQHFAWRLLVCGLIFLVASILLRQMPGITVDGYAVGCMLAFIIPFAIGMAQTTTYLKKFPNQPPK